MPRKRLHALASHASPRWHYLERLADDGAATRATEYDRAWRPQVRHVLPR